MLHEVQCLAQGHFTMWTEGAGNQTTDLLLYLFLILFVSTAGIISLFISFSLQLPAKGFLDVEHVKTISDLILQLDTVFLIVIIICGVYHSLLDSPGVRCLAERHFRSPHRAASLVDFHL